MKADEIFHVYLQAPNSNPPIGFYPRGGNRLVLERYRNSQIAWDYSYAISHFAFVYSRLIDSSIAGVKLNESTQLTLKIFHQMLLTQSKCDSGSDKALAFHLQQSNEKVRKANMSLTRKMRSKSADDKFSEAITALFVLTVYVMINISFNALAGPRVKEACSEHSFVFPTKTLCYLWHLNVLHK